MASPLLPPLALLVINSAWLLIFRFLLWEGYSRSPLALPMAYLFPLYSLLYLLFLPLVWLGVRGALKGLVPLSGGLALIIALDILLKGFMGIDGGVLLALQGALILSARRALRAFRRNGRRGTSPLDLPVFG